MASKGPDFRTLYEDHVEFVWSSLRRLGVHATHLEDSAHDVFVVAWRKLESFDRRRPVRPWLFGIAFRVASDFRERASVRREVGGTPIDSADEAEGPDALVDAQRRRELVRRALAAVPVERRAVLIMHDMDGSAVPAIAVALGVPLNTAYSRLRLARRDFEAELKRLGARVEPEATTGERWASPPRAAAY